MAKPDDRRACGNCRFFDALAAGPDTYDGECRRFPRLPMPDEAGDLVWGYPPADSEEWCGEHQRRLNS